MGYKGYSDFRMALAVDLSQNPREKQVEMEGDICHISAQSAVASLQDTAQIIDRKALKRVCNLVHESQYISCVGVGASSIVGRYLAFRLLRIGKKVTMFEDTHLAAMNAVRSTKGDLWFAISSSGSTKEVVHAVKMLRTPNLRNVASFLTGRGQLSRTGKPWTSGALAAQLKVLGWKWEELKAS